MKSLVQFLGFQGLWFAAVLGAADGRPWLGPLALLPYLSLHAGLVPASERKRELLFAAATGALGTVLDSVLEALALMSYPSSNATWHLGFAPPFITALWIAFGTLPRLSMRWLAGHPWLAAALGALGGPLSYAAGVRLGAVAVGPVPALTWGVLALEYAFVTPLLLRLAPGTAREAVRWRDLSAARRRPL